MSARSTMDRLRSQRAIDAAGWNVFAQHQPYYHVLCDPRMLNPDAEAQEDFWASGTTDVRRLMEFGGLSRVGGLGVDFGCGLGRLTRALTACTDTQLGIDISSAMVLRAAALNAAYTTAGFRIIDDIAWPIETGSASLVISLLVFNHLSTIALMEHSLREVGRVLKAGGTAVFGLQTATWRGEWLRRTRGLFAARADCRQEIRARLTGADGAPSTFSEQEIVTDLFQMEFRRLKSMPLRRLSRVLRASRMTVRRLSRDPADGSTLVAAQKY